MPPIVLLLKPYVRLNCSCMFVKYRFEMVNEYGKLTRNILLDQIQWSINVSRNMNCQCVLSHRFS